MNNVFYISNNFSLIICKAIIKQRKIDNNSVKMISTIDIKDDDFDIVNIRSENTNSIYKKLIDLIKLILVSFLMLISFLLFHVVRVNFKSIEELNSRLNGIVTNVSKLSTSILKIVKDILLSLKVISRFGYFRLSLIVLTVYLMFGFNFAIIISIFFIVTECIHRGKVFSKLYVLKKFRKSTYSNEPFYIYLHHEPYNIGDDEILQLMGSKNNKGIFVYEEGTYALRSYTDTVKRTTDKFLKYQDYYRFNFDVSEYYVNSKNAYHYIQQERKFHIDLDFSKYDNDNDFETLVVMDYLKDISSYLTYSDLIIEKMVDIGIDEFSIKFHPRTNEVARKTVLTNFISKGYQCNVLGDDYFIECLINSKVSKTIISSHSSCLLYLSKNHNLRIISILPELLDSSPKTRKDLERHFPFEKFLDEIYLNEK